MAIVLWPANSYAGRIALIDTDINDCVLSKRRAKQIRATLNFVPFLPRLAVMDIKEREYILDPILPEQGMGMEVAPRGAGKTIIAMGVGLAVANGARFLRWAAPRPRNVLYVDGELPAKVVQERFAMISRNDVCAYL